MSIYPELRVRITKASLPTYWYSRLIGREFDVYKWRSDDYVVKEDYDKGQHAAWGHIAVEDAEVL